MIILQKHSIDLEKRNKLLGNYIKIHRINENMSLSFVAELVKINKGYLSDIENGKKFPQDYTLSRILKILDININLDFEIIYSLKNQLTNIFNYFISLEEDKEISLLKSIIYDSEFKYSLAYIEYYLCEFFYIVKYTNDIHRTNLLKERLFNLVNLMDSFEKTIYLDTCGMNCINNNQYHEALVFLKDALIFAENHQKGVIYYHISICHQKLNQTTFALFHCKIAIEEFNKSMCVKRLLLMHMHEANCFARLFLFKESTKIYLQVLKESKLVNDEDLYLSTLDNLIWSMLKAENYKKVLEYSTQSLSLGSESLDTKLCNTYALFKLEHYQYAINFIDDSLDYCLDNKYYYNILVSIKNLCNNDILNAIVLLKECVEIIKSKNVYEDLLFLYKIIIDSSKKVNNQDDIILYQRKTIDILERNL